MSSFNAQEEQAEKVFEPWYDISQDLDGSQAKKPVAIHLDLTPYRMYIHRNPISLENNFEKRVLYLIFIFFDQDTIVRMKKSELAKEDDPNYWKLLGRMGLKNCDGSYWGSCIIQNVFYLGINVGTFKLVLILQTCSLNFNDSLSK